MHKPLQSLLFLASVFGLLFFVSIIFPSKGIVLSEKMTLRFPSPSELFNEREKPKNIKHILNATEKKENFEITVSPKDSSKHLSGIEYTNKNALRFFFESLKKIKSENKSIRILHYGDSQIEGDRITDYLRLKYQGLYGGSGSGLISLMPLSPSVTENIQNSAGWDRYSVYTTIDSRVKHDNFGVMGGFCRYTSYKRVFDTSSTVTASININTTKFGGSNAMAYKKIKLFYGGAQRKTWCEFFDGPALINADSLNTGGNFFVKEFNVGNGSLNHTFRFTGMDSPDFYGMSLETDQGIFVDNIAQRGSSGTFFHLINPNQLKSFFSYLNVKLIILQYGGNVLPSITDATMAANYGTYVRYQLSVLKKLVPDVSILFIGPSDMCVKRGTDYVTHTFLEETRTAIRKAVLENNYAFYDLYEAMGGKNSMPAWVEQNLASTDYTHFSPQGARKIATLLYTALNNEFQKFEKENK